MGSRADRHLIDARFGHGGQQHRAHRPDLGIGWALFLMDNLGMGIVGVCHRAGPSRLVIHRHTPHGKPTGSRDLLRQSGRTCACSCLRRSATSSPENLPIKSSSIESGMQWSKPYSLTRSTARKLSRFVKNPHNKARIGVRNCHRRPFRLPWVCDEPVEIPRRLA